MRQDETVERGIGLRDPVGRAFRSIEKVAFLPDRDQVAVGLKHSSAVNFDFHDGTTLRDDWKSGE